MTDRLRRIYWDTSVFLCFLSRAEKDRRLICDDVLRHARDGKIIICTSTWTIVEVIRPKGLPPGVPLTTEEVRVLQGMFQWPWIKKYQVHEGIAFKASEIARDCGLKPADAIHAATAIMAGTDVLQRWDRDFNKVKHLIAVEDPVRLSKQMPLIEDAIKPVGPTPDDFPSAVSTEPPASSSVPERPSVRSPDAETE